MKLNLIIILLLFCLNSFSQTTFTKWISTPNDEVLTNLVKIEDEDKYLISLIRGTISQNPNYYDIYYNYSKIYYLADLNFNFVDSIVVDFIDNHRLIPGRFVYANEDQILLFESALDTVSLDEQHYMIWLDQDLSIIKDSLYGMPDRNDAISGFTLNHTQNIVFFKTYPVLNQKVSDSIGYVFWEFDMEGNEINYKTDTIPSSMFIGIVDMESIAKYQVTAVNKIIQFDYNFEFVADYPWQIERFTGLSTREINDSEYFIIGDYNNTTAPVIYENFDLAFVIIDDSINLNNLQTYGVVDTNDRGSRMNFLTTDTIFIGGTKNANCGPVDTWISLYKTNLSGGNLFSKFFGGYGTYGLNFLVATEDGGCLVGGSWWDFYNYPGDEKQHDILILKVNSDGLLALPEDHKILFEITDIIVFPNPGKDYIKIESSFKNLCFQLFDVSGELVIRKDFNSSIKLITDNLPSGSYIYRITKDEEVVKTGKWIKK